MFFSAPGWGHDQGVQQRMGQPRMVKTDAICYEAAAMPELPSLPLSRNQPFRTQDVYEAREHVPRIFCPHGLSMYARGAVLDA